jgi:endonuclease-3
LASNSEKERTRKIIARLKKAYPAAKCSLNHSNPLELLIATILSAQCTDERVNIVTADLFQKVRTCSDYLKVPASESFKTTFAPRASSATKQNLFRVPAKY